jgi:hypothetical protein
MAAAVTHGIAGVGRFVRRELIAIFPVFVFFLIGFLLLISLIKIALEQFSIEAPILSNAVLGAAIAAKAALVLDETPLARALEHYRGIVAITVKTVFYGLVSMAMGYLERFLEAYHKVHGSSAAIQYVIDHASHYRLLAWSLGISIVFSLYFSFAEVSRRMGPGALWKVFFEVPATGGEGQRSAKAG